MNDGVEEGYQEKERDKEVVSRRGEINEERERERVVGGC